VTVLGTQWDIRWHLLIGRDFFEIPQHLMTYSGVTAIVFVSFGVLAWTGADAFRGATGAPARFASSASSGHARVGVVIECERQIVVSSSPGSSPRRRGCWRRAMTPLGRL
jgi:hypothetical protein